MADFFIANSGGLYSALDRDSIIGYVKGHERFGTIITAKDDKGLVAIVRWNWKDFNTAYVLDCIVRPDMRNKQIVKLLVIKAKLLNPQIEFVAFKRKKYSNRERAYMLSQWLKGV